jgi:hypothetical protein
MERLKELVEKLNQQVNSSVPKEEILETVLDITRKICLSDGINKELTAVVTPVAQTQTKEKKDPVREPVSLNEKLKSGANDISEKLIHGAIGSLSEVIGVNQRFIFTHVFFNGEKEYFDKVTSILDKASSFEEANQLFRNILPPEVLNNNPDTTDQFIELLNRRFPSK